MRDVAQGWVAFLSSSKKSRELTSQPTAFPAAGKMGPLVMKGNLSSTKQQECLYKIHGDHEVPRVIIRGKAMDFIVLTHSSRRPVGGSKELSRCYSGALWWSRSLVNRITWEEIAGCPQESRVSLVAPMVNNLPSMWETWVQSLDQKDPMEEGMATHSSILAWRIPMSREA